MIAMMMKNMITDINNVKMMQRMTLTLIDMRLLISYKKNKY